MNSRRKLVLVDYFGVAAVLKLLPRLLFGRISAVHYLFTSTGADFLRRLLLMLPGGPEVQLLETKLDTLDEAGFSLWDRAHDDTCRLADKIVDGLGDRHTYMDFAGAEVATERRQAYLRKTLRQELYWPVLLVRVAEDLVRTGASNKVSILTSAAPFRRQIAACGSLQVDGFSPFKRNAVVMILWFIAMTLLDMLRGLIHRPPSDVREPCVAIEYNYGLADDGSFDDHWWFRHTGLSPKECLIYFLWSRRPATDEVLDRLDQTGVRWRILDDRANGSSRGRTTGFARCSLRDGFKDLIRMFQIAWALPHLNYPTWQLSHGLLLFNHARRWTGFLKEENILLATSSMETRLDPVTNAADRCDAVHAGYHWSSLLAVNAFWLPVHQLYFVWGEAYKELLSGFGLRTAQMAIEVGCIYSTPSEEDKKTPSPAKLPLPGIDQNLFRIAIIDRTLSARSFYSIEQHRIFFDALLKLAENDPRVMLVLKFKDRGVPRLYHDLPDIAERLEVLIKLGRAVRFGGDVSVTFASSRCHITVGLGYNSGAVVADLSGARTMFWDAVDQLRSRKADWYRSIGWDKPAVVFTDMSALVASLADQIEMNDDGESTAWHLGAQARLDLFRDGQTDKRVGNIIRDYMHHRARGLRASEALAALAHPVEALAGDQQSSY